MKFFAGLPATKLQKSTKYKTKTLSDDWQGTFGFLQLPALFASETVLWAGGEEGQFMDALIKKSSFL